MPTPIIATKLFIPPHTNVVPRARLIARLNAGLHRRLTLISAPAGFGKTTLVSMWIADCGRPAAWLSLDSVDSDPVRFLTYLIAALQTVVPTIGTGALTALQSSQSPPIETLLPNLVNEVAALPHQAVLVLDDYHVLDSGPVDQAIAMLVEHMPPQFHLVIATREDPALPLARLRARNQLSELRLADLRFTHAEAASFLNEVMALHLAAGEIAAVATRTEGWVAGMQLAALSLQGQQNTIAFIRSFSGSHHFVLDYLMEEVLNRQPAPIQQFLLCTAILDRLCGPLCDALLRTPEARGQATLEALERANLFLVPLDNERRWYRYHHLFAEALRQRLGQSPSTSPDDPIYSAAELHIRASAWYEAQGLEYEAFYHAAAANDVARIARLAERSWQGMDRSFQSATWLGWVQQLPEQVVRARPVLSTQYAWALMDSGDLDGSAVQLRNAEVWLETMIATSSQPKPSSDGMVIVDTEQFRALPAMIAFARAYSAQTRGDISATVKYAELALNQTPDEHHVLRAQSAVLLGVATWSSGDLDAAYLAFANWVQHMRQAGNLAFALVGVFGLIEIRITQGRLHEAVREYRQALQMASEQTLITVYLDISFALLCLELGDRAAAAHSLQQSSQLGAQSPFVDVPYRWCLAQARLKEAEGDWEAALDLLDEAGRRYVRTPVPDLRPIEACKVRLYLRQGRLASALTWVRERDLGVEDDLSYLGEFEHMVLARVWIAEYVHSRAERAMRDALRLLARLLTAAEAGVRTGSAIEILVLQSIAEAAHSGTRLALAPLSRALALAEPEGYVQLFVGEGPPMVRLLAAALEGGIAPAYVGRLLAAFPADPAQTAALPLSGRASALVEPLSEREREVLHLIAEGLTNQDIATRLYLSLHTVKVHARTIYAKLGASNRTQAVAKGRALGMLTLS